MTSRIFLLFPALVIAKDITVHMTQIRDLHNSLFEGHLKFTLTEEVIGWEVIVTFSVPVTGITVRYYSYMFCSCNQFVSKVGIYIFCSCNHFVSKVVIYMFCSCN